MNRYDYKFVEIPRSLDARAKPGDAFEACKQAILREAEDGWRLVQVVAPFHEKLGISSPTGYQIIFEKPAE